MSQHIQQIHCAQGKGKNPKPFNWGDCIREQDSEEKTSKILDYIEILFKCTICVYITLNMLNF